MQVGVADTSMIVLYGRLFRINKITTIVDNILCFFDRSASSIDYVSILEILNDYRLLLPWPFHMGIFFFMKKVKEKDPCQKHKCNFCTPSHKNINFFQSV